MFYRDPYKLLLKNKKDLTPIFTIKSLKNIYAATSIRVSE